MFYFVRSEEAGRRFLVALEFAVGLCLLVPVVKQAHDEVFKFMSKIKSTASWTSENKSQSRQSSIIRIWGLHRDLVRFADVNYPNAIFCPDISIKDKNNGTGSQLIWTVEELFVR